MGMISETRNCSQIELFKVIEASRLQTKLEESVTQCIHPVGTVGIWHRLECPTQVPRCMKQRIAFPTQDESIRTIARKRQVRNAGGC